MRVGAEVRTEPVVVNLFLYIYLLILNCMRVSTEARTEPVGVNLFIYIYLFISNIRRVLSSSGERSSSARVASSTGR
ncbi:hypothetical protein T492DRAFT_1037230 [Pavlovales sp. CCMP2436]|nr:hypothetical protein T492DRAFT_1037230 [Pavlovales sp. CCMP2436]